MQQLFSPKTLAAHIGLAEQTTYNRHSAGGDIPRAIKLGHLLRFRRTDVESWLDAKNPSTAMATLPPPPGQPSSGGQPSVADQVTTERYQ
jgi:predicted DNA-binding transcriptional regulator AlpA